jgi:hypothetical protein
MSNKDDMDIVGTRAFRRTRRRLKSRAAKEGITGPELLDKLV